jgi:HAMP domain-containing protein
MLSGLRGYVTTRNRAFRSEYEANQDLNNLAWSQLITKQSQLSSEQQKTLDEIKAGRDLFLALPDGMFNLLESDQWRTDLDLFKQQALPLGNQMSTLLDEITTNQQVLLTSDLAEGNASLTVSNRQTLLGGLLALLLGAALAVLFTGAIGGPVRRLTTVAERIANGDLDARAVAGSTDEIGTLAETFNGMTGQLQSNLVQIRQEKKRADDLLNVVIPIGVSLTEERDFNRLLENMLLQAQRFCNARLGFLQLLNPDGSLQYAIVRDSGHDVTYGGTSGRPVPYVSLALRSAEGQPRNDSIAVQTVLGGETINLPITHNRDSFRFGEAELVGGVPVSVLALPLKTNSGQTLGVLELIDAAAAPGDPPLPFDSNLQRMMESFSLLAVAALEGYVREQSLRQQIQKLHIEIDEAKRQKQVSEIVDTDFFQDLQSKARATRARNRRGGDAPPEVPARAPSDDTTPSGG